MKSKENKTKIDRRNFMGIAALGTAAVSLGGISLSCNPKGEEVEVSSKAKEVIQKNYPKYYFPYHNKPATIIDYGLTPDQEVRAKELHSKLYVFDSEPEVDWFEGLYDNMLAGGASGVGGSFTMDAFPWRKLHGFEDPEKIEITKHDWWGIDNIADNVSFVREKEKEGKCMLCLTSVDLEQAGREGKVAIMPDAQNGFYMGNQLDNINKAYEMGLRRTQLAYNRGGTLASGCMDPRDGGLKTFGKECVQRMNEIGMLVDVGHSSSFTMEDVLEVSTSPITCSHAGLRAISSKNPRTHTDEGLKKLADKGGVFGVVGSPGTMREDIPQKADVKDFLRCIDYAVNLIGENHVGFALDQVQAPSFKEFFNFARLAPQKPSQV